MTHVGWRAQKVKYGTWNEDWRTKGVEYRSQYENRE
jgi:hypothetical protein